MNVPPPRCTCITHTQPHSMGYPCTTSKVYMFHTHTTTLTGIPMHHLQGVHVSHTHNHIHWVTHAPPPRCTCITHTHNHTHWVTHGVHVSHTHNHTHWDSTTSKVYMYHTHTTTLTGIPMHHLQGVHVSHTHNHTHWDTHAPPPRCTCITHTQPHSLGYPCTTSKVYMYHTHTINGIPMHHLQGVHVSHTHNHTHIPMHHKVYMYHTHTTTLTGIPMHHLQGVHVSHTHNHTHWVTHAPPPRCTCFTHTQPHSMGYPCTTCKTSPLITPTGNASTPYKLPHKAHPQERSYSYCSELRTTACTHTDTVTSCCTLSFSHTRPHFYMSPQICTYMYIQNASYVHIKQTKIH